eukprot:CAMPEP_0182928352 /NCGR_PEP_ID=MMETSP0105_2-20130417/15542_1 /TAXON_ID=81532 ORGANISM="Acanthoeca-like sp., Strain 10tr" /NCGR_SAMPLE_ID=MMETSP0105_2 /ASSEMBLY_ACC=CAM_ASM_000205 /LENGTH=404 /DNA_ID=CAMNT_0025066353 /DNA_START=22 /DNA_END=1236 /DNA_ORIENTATION=-
MVTAAAKGELTAWLATVTQERGVDVSQYLDVLVEQGLSKSVLYDVPDDEWADIDIPLGHRIVIRVAASEIYQKAEKANLTDQVGRLSGSRDALIASAAADRAQLDAVAADVTTREGEIVQAKTTLTAAQGSLPQKQAALGGAEGTVAATKAEIAQLIADIERAKADKDAALQQKEEAIKRAVMIGTGQMPTPPPAAVQPAAAVAPPSQPAAYSASTAAPAPAAVPAYQPNQPAPTVTAPIQQPAAAAAEVPLEAQPWYHDTISREDCEAKLAAGADGDYMIRKSSRGQNSYSLSVRATGGSPKHFKVEMSGGKWRLAQKNSDGQTFPSIADLVAYYVVSTAAGTALVQPVFKANNAGGATSFLPPPTGGRQCWDAGCTGMPMAPDDRFCGGCGKKASDILKWAP